MPDLQKQIPQVVASVVKRSCEIKAEVVAADERESDRRRILNYGIQSDMRLRRWGYKSLVHGKPLVSGWCRRLTLPVSKVYAPTRLSMLFDAWSRRQD